MKVANNPIYAPCIRRIPLVRQHHHIRKFIAKSHYRKERCYLTVELDKPADYIYKVGQKVTGHVTLHAEGGMAHFRSLSVTLRGVKHGENQSEMNVVNKRKYLIPPTHDRHTLKEGKYDFKFKFHLQNQKEILHYFIDADLDQSTYAKMVHACIVPKDIRVGVPLKRIHDH